MAVPYLNLAADYAQYRDHWVAILDEIGAKGSFVLGANCKSLEQEFANYINAPYAIGLANGTDALLFALIAAGVKAGDEVITTPWTFYASSEVILHLRAKPVFVDIDPSSYNMQIDAISACINERTRAVLGVHIFGCPMHLAALRSLCNQHGLKLIEDCAQSCGAQSQDMHTGSVGDFGCFSFYPTKVLNAWGDGGMIVCHNDADQARILHLRNHAAVRPFVHNDLGHNSRLDEVQAALLRLKLKDLDRIVTARRLVAKKYAAQLGGLEDLTLPSDPPHGLHAYNLYTIASSKRDQIVSHFKKEGIGHSICYPVPMHRQPVFEHLGSPSLESSEYLSARTVSLPIFPQITDSQIDQVCAAIKKACS